MREKCLTKKAENLPGAVAKCLLARISMMLIGFLIATSAAFAAGNIGKDTVVTALDLNGKVSWRAKKMDNHHGGVILLDENLYGTSAFTNGKKWISLDFQTGQCNGKIRNLNHLSGDQL